MTRPLAEQPLVSIVLPTYNRAEYLGECLWSLEEQHFPQKEYEIIIVDDGSTDSTPYVVQYFLESGF